MTALREFSLVAAAILCNVTAQVAMKRAAQDTVLAFSVKRLPVWLSTIANPWLWGSLVAYGVSFALTLVVYRSNPLSVVSPLMAGAIIALTAVSGAVLFAEPLGWQRIGAIGLIIAGIWLLAR